MTIDFPENCRHWSIFHHQVSISRGYLRIYHRHHELCVVAFHRRFTNWCLADPIFIHHWPLGLHLPGVIYHHHHELCVVVLQTKEYGSTALRIDSKLTSPWQFISKCNHSSITNHLVSIVPGLSAYLQPLSRTWRSCVSQTKCGSTIHPPCELMPSWPLFDPPRVDHQTQIKQKSSRWGWVCREFGLGRASPRSIVAI